MSIADKIDWLHRSSARMVELLKRPKNKEWWSFMRKESWIHVKRSLELWWLVLRKKD